ncbi:glycosyltransferase [Rhizobium sp. MC63]|uniref:Glycosyltransferase n=1 Tax=Rhizobium mulingense TaxID=3031128 RepID=A0ACC6N6N5_9HYPH|nr:MULTISPECIES: glycosyltransferase [unclassified Rhizobium]MDF0700415.1 glycosyltransferase [Rhizobium sp. MC63]MEA3521100.1 glycosyltransferase [Rhizobium sp. MJ31]
MSSVLKHIVFVLLLALCAALLPQQAFDEKARDAALIVGVIGLWRWSWGLLHLVRSVWFRLVRFPAMRRAAEAAAASRGLGHAYFLITSFRIDAPTTTKVYRGAFVAAANAPAGATIICSIVELGDERLIRRLAEVMYGDSLPFRLEIVRIAGTGKRDALAAGFRAIAALNPAGDDTVSVIDGDSIVPPDLVERCACMFLVNPNLGALTTDEVCTVEGADIFKQWYSMRFAQRQILMSSHGLAGRVLTLTGRMSMFRAPLACNPDFIDHVQNDYIDHWRLGRIRMLTGDDKSSWFWLLKNGYNMYYVPDVQVETIEQPPSPSFIGSAYVLMTRWFGNMLRTNARALSLGPMRIGAFTWWSVLDQRMSMWTSLSGVTLALLGTVMITPWTAAFYVLWVIVSRYILALTFLTVRPSINLVYIPLLYFNQIFGSAVKVMIFFRLDRQKWTRQKTAFKRTDSRFDAAFKVWSSRLVNTVAVLVFVSALVFLSNMASYFSDEAPERLPKITDRMF